MQQMQFLAAFVELGGRAQDGVTAALRAGYGDGDRREAKRCADVLLASPKIVKALKAAVAEQFGAATALALRTLIDLCQSGPPSARLAAAKEILDRGIGPVISRSAVVQTTGGIEDVLAMLDRREAAEPQLVIDGEATVLSAVPGTEE